MFANDDVVWLSWKLTAEERVSNPRHTNEAIAVYVTAGARINLHRYLERLEKMRFIMTDSVIFIQPRGEPELIGTGDNLGDMTSELEPHEYISEFVSGGLKNYAYKIMYIKNISNQPKTV